MNVSAQLATLADADLFGDRRLPAWIRRHAQPIDASVATVIGGDVLALSMGFWDGREHHWPAPPPGWTAEEATPHFFEGSALEYQEERGTHASVTFDASPIASGWHSRKSAPGTYTVMAVGRTSKGTWTTSGHVLQLLGRVSREAALVRAANLRALVEAIGPRWRVDGNEYDVELTYVPDDRLSANVADLDEMMAGGSATVDADMARDVDPMERESPRWRSDGKRCLTLGEIKAALDRAERRIGRG